MSFRVRSALVRDREAVKELYLPPDFFKNQEVKLNS